MTVMIVLLYNVNLWSADIGAVKHTSSNKDGCIKMMADKDGTETIGVSSKAV